MAVLRGCIERVDPEEDNAVPGRHLAAAYKIPPYGRPMEGDFHGKAGSLQRLAKGRLKDFEGLRKRSARR